MKKIKAAVFDLDGVIANTSVFHFMAWNKMACEIGIELPLGLNESLKGISRMKSLELILDLDGKKYSDLEKIILADKKNGYYLDLIGTISRKDLLPGVIGCFETLKGTDIKIALASASKNASLIVKLLDIKEYFDFIVDAKEVANGKPDPEIFIKAAEGVKATPINCIGIEDSNAGIEAINNCGMFSIGIGNKKVLKKARICIRDLSEFNIEIISMTGGFN